MQKPHQRFVTVQDDALPSMLATKLIQQVKALGSTSLRRTYQTTFWYGFEQPTCLPELAIGHLQKFVEGRAKIVGCEWWLSRMYTHNVQVDFHRDRDEKRALRGGSIRHPVVSSILYLSTCRGGQLAVTDAEPNERNSAKAPDRGYFDLVDPQPNRFVFFDGTLTHGVLNAEGEMQHRRLPKERHLRLGLVVNFWNRRPESVPTFAESRAYRTLAL